MPPSVRKSSPPSCGSVVASLVSEGWPPILSSLKTLLETGETLPDSDRPSTPARLGLTREGE